MNINNVTLAGNLTRDPEIRYTPKGTAICKFGVAINRKWTDETGKDREVVTFVDVAVFGKKGEAIGQYFRKGKCIYVSGRLDLDEWEDKETNKKRSKLSVVASEFQFVGFDNRDGEKSASNECTPENPSHPDDDVPY